MSFCDSKEDCIELNLDDIFDENGYINENDKTKYCKNNVIKKIKLIRTKNNSIKIGKNFLSKCKGLTNIDLSILSNVIQIGDCFL